MGGLGVVSLTWQQHRQQALFTLIAFAVLAALMIPTGLGDAQHVELACPLCPR